MNYSTHWDHVIQMRLLALQKSDWTQGADSPLSDEKKAEWAAYRQQWRDVFEKSKGIDKATTDPYEILELPRPPQ